MIKIIVGSDLSRTSDAALSQAFVLARGLGGSVVIVHVVDTRDLTAGLKGPLFRKEMAAISKLVAWRRAAAERLLPQQILRVKGNPTRDAVSFAVREGIPSVELLAAAKKHRANLIALGKNDSHGLSGVVARVLAVAPIAVLVVPETPQRSLAIAAPKVLVGRPRAAAVARA